MPSSFTLTRRIEFAETDMAGIVHFSNFFRMMEMAEHAFFRSLGFSVQGVHEGALIGWPRVNASCDYISPLRFEDEVEIRLTVEEVRTRSIRYQFAFFKLPERREVARGKLAVVCVTGDTTTGKFTSITIPDEVRAALSSAESSLPVDLPSKVLPPGE